MSDFSSITTQYNKNTDASPDFTGTALALGGTAGQNELRWCAIGAGGASIASASWPYTSRPLSGTAAVGECWAYTTSDNSGGVKVATYDGTNAKANVFRLSFSNDGTLASAPTASAFADSTHPTPSPGTQPGTGNGSPIVNGHATDTSSTSYLKGNFYGSGLTAGGTQETPSAGTVGTTLAATSGTAGDATPSAGSWLTTWQSLQGWTQDIKAPAIAHATTAFFWYFALVLYTGVNMATGAMAFSPITLQYTFS